ncbi:hypothetical protein QEH45_gp52 [Microbacterium phage Shocker]|uniref:Uncharacterized protein n=1 Tax=Microbacterium phage Shocker TaxID=2805839 RepID=A0A890URK6_9CAUD|nr:hypothetical protein QEH45_gp52 [Microbacterium phage Shocker]QRI45106.1 hypothetical protein SEA_SHOCKER_52 [Microbacterium phage Shocker]
MSEFQTKLCPACAAGIPEECQNPDTVVGHPEWIIPCIAAFTSIEASDKPKGQAGRPLLDPDQVTDVKSTGRKRAAMVMPFLEGRVCDWAGLKHAGGGVIPILGCQGNTITEAKKTEDAREKGYDEVGHRHHGPDKNVLNNTPGLNLHGICTVCHTRWHAINDPFYDPKGRPANASTPFLPVEVYYLHDPQTAFTDEEWELAEQWWELPVKDRGDYPFVPPETARKALPMPAEPATLIMEENPFPDSPFAEIGDSE